MRRKLSLLALAALTLPAAAGEVADATVAALFGTSGVTHETKTATRYGMTYSDLNYRDASGFLVTLRLGDVKQFELWKQVAAGHLEPVPGVGAEAFRLDTVRSVCARSASTAACVTPHVLRKGAKATDEQLIALVKAAL